jgi:Diguanylate cyclase, GGDEF domain
LPEKWDRSDTPLPFERRIGISPLQWKWRWHAYLKHLLQAEAASLVARRISESFANDGQGPKLSVSGGVAVYPQDGDSIEGLLSQADSALYARKQQRSLPAECKPAARSGTCFQTTGRSDQFPQNHVLEQPHRITLLSGCKFALEGIPCETFVS